MTVSFQKGCYGVRLADAPGDVAACQALRHSAFFGSPGQDSDKFDASCDHLMIADRHGLVATCRVMVLKNGTELGRTYAAERYDLSRLALYPAPMLELGRFCVAERAQDADVLRLAWGALAQIVDASDVQMMFGCTSFAGTDPAPYTKAFGVLGTRAIAPNRWAPRVGSPEVVPLGTAAAPDGVKLIPPMLRSYLALGGWVSDHAVVDRVMNTLHVFTGLEIAAIPKRRANAMRAVGAVTELT